MSNENPFFVSREGFVWACWLDGKPAVNLGNEQAFWVSAEKLFDELNPSKTAPTVKPGDDASSIKQESLVPRSDRSEVADRIEERYEVTISGKIYGGGHSREVTIFDLSTHGCRIQDASYAKPGTHVSIKMGSIGPVAAIVRWRRDNFIGLKFENALYPSILEHIKANVSLR